MMCPAAAVADAPAAERSVRGNLVIDGVPEIPDAVSERVRRFQHVREATFADWAGDGGVLVITRFGETHQIHHVAEPGGARVQLTFAEEPTRVADASPAGQAIVVARDNSGDEFYQGYLRAPEGGPELQFTRSGARNRAFTWTRDGARLAHYRAAAGARDWEIVLVEAEVEGARLGEPGAGVRRRVLIDDQGALRPRDWAPDGRRLLLARSRSSTENELLIYNVETGALIELTPQADAYYSGGQFTRDGKHVVVVTDLGGEFRRIARIAIADGAVEFLSPDLGWDVESYDLSPDGRTVALALNAGGVSALGLLDMETHAVRRGPALPPGVISGMQFSPDGAAVGFSFQSATEPKNVWSFDLETLALTRWTDSETGALDRSRFIEPELVSYPSFDEENGAARQIPAYIYRPRAAGPRPVIVYLHGGPESQYRPGFSSTFQYWAGELGLAIVAPNVRGSSGYGRRYLSLDDGLNREDSVRDIGALLDWIEEQPDLDADRVLVYGGSYGGYLVLASLVHYDDRIAGGVNVVGISNFVTFLENTMGYRRNLRRSEYGDERDPEMRAHLEAISPLTNAARITSPLFVIQGANDPRVPASEADQMVEAVRSNGGEAWYLLALDEGHSFRRRGNRFFRRAAETLFIDQILGPRS